MLLRSANLLIYIYLIFCGCILAFDLATLALQKRREQAAGACGGFGPGCWTISAPLN